jgi:hypothetical protein
MKVEPKPKINTVIYLNPSGAGRYSPRATSERMEGVVQSIEKCLNILSKYTSSTIQ